MLLSELIEELQEIQSKYNRDLEIVTIAEIGVVTINEVFEAYSDYDEDELTTLDEDNEIRVNSVFLSWN